ncbi:MAG: COG1470 family protein [Candidatus Syntropharchaeales archaeon]|nr:hypothetical protein [Candidatus Syntrophoarchaeum sp.]
MEQKVHIGRKGPDSIEFDHGEMRLPMHPGDEVSFTITIINYTIPTHVHLAVSRELKGYLSIINDNPYVRTEEKVPVLARLPKDSGDGVYTGKIHIISGYGSAKGGFTITLGGEDRKSERKSTFIEKDPIKVEMLPKRIRGIKIREKTPLKGRRKSVKLPEDLKILIGITSTILILLLYVFLLNPASFWASLLASIGVMLLIFYIFNIYRSQG